MLAKLFYTTHHILETFFASLRSFVVGISKVLLRQMSLDEIASSLKTEFITNRGLKRRDEKITIKIESELEEFLMSPLGFYGNNIVHFLIDFFCSDFLEIRLKMRIDESKSAQARINKR